MLAGRTAAREERRDGEGHADLPPTFLVGILSAPSPQLVDRVGPNLVAPRR